MVAFLVHCPSPPSLVARLFVILPTVFLLQTSQKKILLQGLSRGFFESLPFQESIEYLNDLLPLRGREFFYLAEAGSEAVVVPSAVSVVLFHSQQLIDGDCQCLCQARHDVGRGVLRVLVIVEEHPVRIADLGSELSRGTPCLAE